ncbi:2'-5' RNA ligase family protein [Sphaerisporangium sp. NPDC088356]|uniref:2'-5' RNA ligase family protein n=1 Tax=Sphaerisporangium sp. NPDC088356 TaxID=3154871 RepID=UPI00341C4C23
MAGDDTETRNHWWWRPGWCPGRSFYTWHFLMDRQPELHDFVERLRPELDKFPVLDPIPVQWLHMTTQGVGFIDETTEENLAAIGAQVAGRMAGRGPLQVQLGPLVADAEGIHLPVRPTEAVGEIRRVIRGAIGEVWGDERVPEAADGFHPHVSLAYANTSGAPLAPIREVLNRYADVLSVTLMHVALIDLNRDEGMYRWRTVLTPSLGRGLGD